MSRLAGWAEAPFAPEHPVAFGAAGAKTRGDLFGDVGALAPALAGARGRRVLLHCDDSYAFLVGWLAVVSSGATAVLPPNRQAGALRRLAPEAALALIDGADAPQLPAATPCLSPLSPPPATPLARFDPIPRDAIVAELFTSGTTGAGRVVPKRLRHLADEVDVLEERFGASLPPETQVLATVGPQHVYGLLFRVLWPLATGRPFLRSPLLHPEELLGEAPTDAPFVVVSTPASLRHLVERKRPAAGCVGLFSSAGPLPAEVARASEANWGQLPFEIYGSTETGGVASRRQSAPGVPWQTLPSVEVHRDPKTECLAVVSPFVSVGEPRSSERLCFVTGDRFRSVPDGFLLDGRADRVIKVGEKRLALADMESRLDAHPTVREVALVGLEREGATRVGAAVVPDESAWQMLHAEGRRSLTKLLTEHLAPDFDRVLLPRAWRFVPSLPRNAQGKLPEAALRSLFEGAAAPRAPERMAVQREDHVLEMRLRIPWDLSFLDGHFPGTPLVAGVVQVHFVMQALEELLGQAPVPERLEALKFHDVLKPGDEAQLRVSLRDDGRGFDFSLADAEGGPRTFCTGRGVVRS